MTAPSCSVVLSAFVALAAADLCSQGCAVVWAPGSIAGTNGVVNAAIWWDRDGAGPLPPVLAAGGGFSGAGSVLAANVAWFDPASGQWSALGAGAND
ncbi:MAG: hypothetical protein HZB39_21540 [Planctomycetes bacterium]|nr:hypothetical protein [Planctomycetota bacterium]